MIRKKILADERRRRVIIAVAMVMSLLLYLAGVFSGLYANKIFERKALSDIQSLKNETERNIQDLETITKEELESLKGYINFLETNLNSMQLEGVFVETLTQEQRCNFSTVSIDYLIEELQYYRDILPFRIEEYEKQRYLSEDYLILKQQYNQLSVLTWILARNTKKKCDTPLIHGLYFYSVDCEDCVEQGEELDIVTEEVLASGEKIMLFTVDFNADDLIIRFLKDFYKIEDTPAVMLNDKVYQGRLFESEELLDDIGT